MTLSAASSYIQRLEKTLKMLAIYVGKHKNELGGRRGIKNFFVFLCLPDLHETILLDSL